MTDKISRRDLLRLAGAGALALGMGRLGLGEADAARASAKPLVVVAKNQSPAAMVRAALAGLGGLKKFMKPGATVVVKPNAAWQRRPDQAANTNPEVVAEVVRLCKQAGAKVVKVMDHPVDKPASITFRVSGIRDAVQKAGGIMIDASSPSLYRNLRIRRGRVLKSSKVLRDVMEADLFINVPIAKVHSAVPYTIALKNMMGVTLDRGAFHNSPNLGQAIADYATEVKPHIHIVDAVRALHSNGPKGPGETTEPKLVIATTDPVAADAYIIKNVFGKNPAGVDYLKFAKAAGVGEYDLRKITVKHA